MFPSLARPLENGTKPNKQNVYEIDSFNKFHFSQSQEILDTLIDVKRVKYSSQQLTANCVAAKRCLRYFFKLICESPTTGNTNFHHH